MNDDNQRLFIFLALLIGIISAINAYYISKQHSIIISQLSSYQDSVNVLIQENIRLNEMQFELSKSIITAMGFKPSPMVYAVEVKHGIK